MELQIGESGAQKGLRLGVGACYDICIGRNRVVLFAYINFS